MGKPRTYTIEQFIEAVKASTSIRQVLHILGLREAGGNYKATKLRIEKLGLNNDHFLGQGHLKGKKNTWHPEIPLEKILVENSTYGGGTYKLKNRLFKANYFEHKCYKCDGIEWLGKPIPLELEHKNGNSRDNRIENLTLLCPNCHAQTETYRGKNKKG